MLTRLATSLYKALVFKISGQQEKLAWQKILVADGLRIIGCCRLASRLALSVHVAATTDKHRFWSTHAAGVALHYAGDLRGAERAFFQSQGYANALQLSFSLQHLGKLNVELGRYELAEQQLKEALDIRHKLNKTDLASSTERALQGLRALRA